MLATLDASGVVLVPERRRTDRVDLDLTDPAEYKAMRRQPNRSGNVLIIDQTPAFHQFVADMLSRYHVTVHLASDEAEVIEACKLRRIALVMINTSAADMDPYKLCQAIKKISRRQQYRSDFPARQWRRAGSGEGGRRRSGRLSEQAADWQPAVVDPDEVPAADAPRAIETKSA
ncbi:hypothetical protein ACFS07_24290 [Undibacterium arcticum]